MQVYVPLLLRQERLEDHYHTGPSPLPLALRHDPAGTLLARQFRRLSGLSQVLIGAPAQVLLDPAVEEKLQQIVPGYTPIETVGPYAGIGYDLGAALPYIKPSEPILILTPGLEAQFQQRHFMEGRKRFTADVVLFCLTGYHPFMDYAGSHPLRCKVDDLGYLLALEPYIKGNQLVSKQLLPVGITYWQKGSMLMKMVEKVMSQVAFREVFEQEQLIRTALADSRDVWAYDAIQGLVSHQQDFMHFEYDYWRFALKEL